MKAVEEATVRPLPAARPVHAAAPPAPCRAASSRCSPWPAAWRPIRRSSCSTSCRWGWRRSSSTSSTRRVNQVAERGDVHPPRRAVRPDRDGRGRRSRGDGAGPDRADRHGPENSKRPCPRRTWADKEERCWSTPNGSSSSRRRSPRCTSPTPPAAATGCCCAAASVLMVGRGHRHDRRLLDEPRHHERAHAERRAGRRRSSGSPSPCSAARCSCATRSPTSCASGWPGSPGSRQAQTDRLVEALGSGTATDDPHQRAGGLAPPAVRLRRRPSGGATSRGCGRRRRSRGR